MTTAALIAGIIAAVQAGLAAAPSAIDIVAKAKAFIAALFSAGLISKTVQDATHAHLDSLMELALAGVIPEHWKVQPDPPSPAEPTPLPGPAPQPTAVS